TGTISTMSGGTQTVSSGSLGTVTTMSGGEQIVSNGGTGTVAAMNGGVQQVENGGTSLNTHVNSGGVQNVAGTATGTIVKGGTQNVKNGGTSKDTTISAGAQNVEAGASADGAILKGGTQNVKTGATVTNTTVSAGTQNVENGGTANNTTVNSGGVQAVKNGGVVSGGTVAKGAALVVENGAEVKDTTVEGGWVESPDGDINGGTLKGGEYTVVSGVSVERMTLEGGTQFVEAGGRTTSTTIEKNGTQILQAGTENNTGGVSEHITLNGGTITVKDYATAQIDKAEGGMVELLDAGLATAIFGNVSDTAAGSYTVDTLFARGDTVILGQGNATPSPVGNKLNVGTMDGYANFVVNTDLANNVSDEIHIENAKNADKANTVRINYDPTLAAGKTVTNTKTLVATVKQGKAVFEGAESNIGGLKYLPNLVTEDGGASWYIATMEKKGASDGSHHVLMGMTAGLCYPDSDPAGTCAAQIFEQQQEDMKNGGGLDTVAFCNQLGKQ
ncbi:MAG: hypothetical protein II738_06710, partial [Clostridia bacterium]|nr:hypothetical protein [Clostridia bacterium]